ncbi:MAG: hypothetical protein AAB507_01525, partial [Patescibacteria group bacterium]
MHIKSQPNVQLPLWGDILGGLGYNKTRRGEYWFSIIVEGTTKEARMPTTKVLPDAETFVRFKKVLLKRGFREISPVEFRKDFQRLGLKAPSPREGREVGFRFWSNGLEVVVWTTFLAGEGRAREEDAGWVLIKDGDKPLYFSHSLRRTKNFLRNLLWHAGIAKWRAEHRPLCPMCQKRMRIAHGKGIKSRFWACINPAFHAKAVFLPWDHELPEWAL